MLETPFTSCPSGSTTVTYQGRELDLSTPWRRASLSELIEEQIGDAIIKKLTA